MKLTLTKDKNTGSGTFPVAFIILGIFTHEYVIGWHTEPPIYVYIFSVAYGDR